MMIVNIDGNKHIVFLINITLKRKKAYLDSDEEFPIIGTLHVCKVPGIDLEGNLKYFFINQSMLENI